MIPARKLFGMVVGIHNVLRTQSENIYYTSRLWRDKNGYNLPGCMTGSDSQETKLPTYRKTLCLGMRIGKNVASLWFKSQRSLSTLWLLTDSIATPHLVVTGGRGLLIQRLLYSLNVTRRVLIIKAGLVE